MYQIQQSLIDYYKNVRPRKGYIYYFLDDNLRNTSRDLLKIGTGFFRSPWIDGAFLFESDSYVLKSLSEFLAAQHLARAGFKVWSEWTYYYSRLWAAVGLCRLMGAGTFYLTGLGPIMIMRKELDEIPDAVEMRLALGEDSAATREGYLVFRDPGGGAHMRNWKMFYVVLTDILTKAGVLDLDIELVHAMSSGDAESRYVMKADEEIYGFPSLYKVTKLDIEQMKSLPEQHEAPPLQDWMENQAQFDGGGFTEEFKTYYKFMVDSYSRDDGLPEALSIIEHALSWLLAVLPDDLRAGYKARYYELVERFAPSEEDMKTIHGWLDRITVSSK